MMDPSRSVVLSQGWLHLPGDIWQCLDKCWLSQLWGCTSNQWVAVRDAVKCPPRTRQPAQRFTGFKMECVDCAVVGTLSWVRGDGIPRWQRWSPSTSVSGSPPAEN